MPPEDRLRLLSSVSLQRVQQVAAHGARPSLHRGQHLLRRQQARVRCQRGRGVLQELHHVLSRASPQPLSGHLLPQRPDAVLHGLRHPLLALSHPASQLASVAIHSQLVVRVDRHRVHQDVERVPHRRAVRRRALGLAHEREDLVALRQRLVACLQVPGVQLQVSQVGRAALLVLVQVLGCSLSKRQACPTEHQGARRVHKVHQLRVPERVQQLLCRVHLRQLLVLRPLLRQVHQPRHRCQRPRHGSIHDDVEQRHQHEAVLHWLRHHHRGHLERAADQHPARLQLAVERLPVHGQVPVDQLKHAPCALLQRHLPLLSHLRVAGRVLLRQPHVHRLSRLHVLGQQLVASERRVVQPLQLAPQITHRAVALLHSRQHQRRSLTHRLPMHRLRVQHVGLVYRRAGLLLLGGSVLQTHLRCSGRLPPPEDLSELGVHLLQQRPPVLQLPLLQLGQVRAVHHLVQHPRPRVRRAAQVPLVHLSSQPGEHLVHPLSHLERSVAGRPPDLLIWAVKVLHQQLGQHQLLSRVSPNRRLVPGRAGSLVVPLVSLDELRRAAHVPHRPRRAQQLGHRQEPVAVVVGPHHRRAAARDVQRVVALALLSLRGLRGTGLRQPLVHLEELRLERARVVCWGTHHRRHDGQRPLVPLLLRQPVAVPGRGVRHRGQHPVSRSNDLPLLPHVAVRGIVRVPLRQQPAVALQQPAKHLSHPAVRLSQLGGLLYVRRQLSDLPSGQPQEEVVLLLQPVDHRVPGGSHLLVSQLEAGRQLDGVRRLPRSSGPLPLRLPQLVGVVRDQRPDLRVHRQLHHLRVAGLSRGGRPQPLRDGLRSLGLSRTLRRAQLLEVLERHHALGGYPLQPLRHHVPGVLRVCRPPKLLSLLLLQLPRAPHVQVGARSHTGAHRRAAHSRVPHGRGVDARGIQRPHRRAPQVSKLRQRGRVRVLAVAQHHRGELVARQVTQRLRDGLRRLLKPLSEPVHQRSPVPGLAGRHRLRRLVHVVVRHPQPARALPSLGERQRPGVHSPHQLRRG